MDGKQVNSNPITNDFNQIISTPIPSNAQVIAISVTNIAGNAGLRAAFSDESFVTDSSWKCSEKLVDGWQTIGFDDSSWPAPTTTGTPTSCSSLPASAKWLWTERYYSSIITIYCRKTLSKFGYFNAGHHSLFNST